MKPLEIAGRRIGSGQPCFIIAEAGVNHNGDLGVALQLVEAAAAAGADAIKFQTWKTELVIARSAPKADYQLQQTDPEESQFDMVKKLELSAGDFARLKERAKARGILFLSTPDDVPSVQLLEALDVPAFKIASGEITNALLLQTVARTGRPIILSTGMADLDEVAEAVAVLKSSGGTSFALLHCLSNYPAPVAETNLRAMRTLADQFQVPVGFSDHTLGLEVPIAAIALGAQILEKHLTLDRSMAGPDHQASLNPAQFLALVSSVRQVEQALGDGIKRPMPSEANTRLLVRRSLVAARELREGTQLTESDIAVKRPGLGLPSKQLAQMIGKTTRRMLAEDELIQWEDLT